jgi:hypothetical protein
MNFVIIFVSNFQVGYGMSFVRVRRSFHVMSQWENFRNKTGSSSFIPRDESMRISF